MLLLLMFLFIFPINAGISNIKRAQTLELLKSFFNSHFDKKQVCAYYF